MADIKIKKTDSAECFNVKLAASQSESANDYAEQRLAESVENIVGFPVDNSKALEEQKKQLPLGDKAGKKRLDLEIKTEKARFKEHDELYQLMLNDSIRVYYQTNIFQTPDDFVENRANLMQMIFETTFLKPQWANKKNPETSGLNDRKRWNASNIKVVKKEFINTLIKNEGKGDSISAYEDTMKAPLYVAISKDPSGNVAKLIQMGQQLMEDYLALSYKWKEPVFDPDTGKMTTGTLQDIDRQFTIAGDRGGIIDVRPNFTSKQQSKVIARLSEEILHTEARNIITENIPDDPQEFIKWRNNKLTGDVFMKQLKNASERHKVGAGGFEYIMIPLHVDEKRVKYLKKLRGDNYIEHENAYLTYLIPENLPEFFKDIKNNDLITKEKLKKHIKPNILENGFYRATEDVVSKNDLIQGTLKPKKKFGAFTRGIFVPETVDKDGNEKGFEYQPPEEWMKDLWNGVEMQRNWNEDFFKKILTEKVKKSADKFNEYFKQIDSQLGKAGFPALDVQEIKDAIKTIGGLEYNIFEDKDGNFATPNTFVRKADRWSYGNASYYNSDYKEMLEIAIDDLELQVIPDYKSNRTDHLNILDSPNISAKQELESTEEVKKLDKLIEDRENVVNLMKTRLWNKDDTDIDRGEILAADRILASKHRSLFTNKLKRRKDRNLHYDYTDQAHKAIYFTDLKTQLIKTLLANRDKPNLIKWIMNEMKTVAGHPDIEAGFMGFEYPDKRVAKWLPGEWTPEQVADLGLTWRGYKTGSNLGMFPSLTNNFQRLSGYLNIGYEPYRKGINAWKDGHGRFTSEQIKSQVRETGLIEPFNMYIDMLAGGIAEASEDLSLDFIMPLVDTVALWKNSSKNQWLASSSGWNRLLNSSLRRNPGELADYKRIEKIKELLHDHVHSNSTNPKVLREELFNLKLGLTKNYINKLVKWKLHWWPFGAGKKTFTMMAGETEMRGEIGAAGFIMAEEMGRVDTTGDNWKYTDSPEAVRAARWLIYTNFFGLSKPFMAKMFRGAVGGTGFQWKQYDWNQIITEHQKFRNAVLSRDGWQKAGLPFEVIYQVIKKSVRAPGLKSPRYKEMMKNSSKLVHMNKKFDNKAVNDLTNFLLARGLPTIVFNMMWWQVPNFGLAYEIAKFSKALGFSNTITQRGLYGAQSAYLNRVLNAIQVAPIIYALMMRGAIRDEDERDLDSFLRDILPSGWSNLIMSMVDFKKYAYKGAKLYIPTPFKEATGVINQYMK